jgi:hypothetical protein
MTIADGDILHYLAYGSNMLRERLAERVGQVGVVGGVRLTGYRLGFNMLSRDGSGKCNASLTGSARHSLHGVVYRMTGEQKRLLDHYEGPRYESRWLEVGKAGGAMKIFTYVGREEHVATGLSPYSWYKAFVHAGALQHRLPGPYIAGIAASPTIADPDGERHQRNVQVLRATQYADIVD